MSNTNPTMDLDSFLGANTAAVQGAQPHQVLPDAEGGSDARKRHLTGRF